MENEKKTKGKNTLRRHQSGRQRISYRQIFIISTISLTLVFLLFITFNISDPKDAKATTTVETLSSGSFIINMGITEQTVANGLKPYGMIYDLMMNYYVPVKWVIDTTKVKDGTDFTYNGVDYRGGPFIIPAEYIDTTVASRITYWQSLGVQGIYTTSSIDVPVYMTITTYPLILIDTLSSNQSIITGYYNNAGLPPTAYEIGAPAGLNSCHDMWVNPHGDPTWATHSYLYNFVTVQKSYIWSQCHAVSNLEGCENTSSPFQRLNYLTTNSLKCWKTTGGGASYCGPSITQTHTKNPSSPYTYYYPTDPVAQFMGTMSGACLNGSEQWFQPQSSGAWRSASKRIVTTGTGTSPGEGVLMVYGPAYGNDTNGYVMYTSGHDFTTSGTVAEQVAVQRSFLNYMLLAGRAKQILISSYSIPSSFTGLQPQPVSVNVSAGMGPYTYLWTSTLPGFFYDPTASSTFFVPDNSDTNTSGIVRCVITDACGRQNFASQMIYITPSPLPINLTSFTAHVVHNNLVRLKWETASEINNDYFSLERSVDGMEYALVKMIKGAGNSTSPKEYTYDDVQPLNGLFYYRLRQTDFDGKFELFNPIAVNLNRTSGTAGAVRVVPNPFDNEFSLEFISNVSKELTIEFTNLRSKVISSEKIMAEEGINIYRFDRGNDLHPGVHIIRIMDGNAVLASAKAVKK